MSGDLEVRNIETMDRVLTSSLNKLREQVKLPSIDSSVDTYREAALIVDSAVGFEYAMPLPPRVFHVGPLVPIERTPISKFIFIPSCSCPFSAVQKGSGHYPSC
jgi:hypothetical protein